jgi:hypothetical protein
LRRGIIVDLDGREGKIAAARTVHAKARRRKAKCTQSAGIGRRWDGVGGHA